MKITKSYTGYVNAVDSKMIQHKVRFVVVVEFGLFSYLFNLRSNKNYVMDIMENDIRAIVYGYDCKKLFAPLVNEIETSIKYSVKKELAMYRDCELKNLQIVFMVED